MENLTVNLEDVVENTDRQKKLMMEQLNDEIAKAADAFRDEMNSQHTRLSDGVNKKTQEMLEAGTDVTKQELADIYHKVRQLPETVNTVSVTSLMSLLKTLSCHNL